MKYRVLFQIVYATGLRLSEVANLRRADLNPVRQLITVRGGKGRKDRIVMLTNKLKTLINHYLDEFKPQTHLFEEVGHYQIAKPEPLQNRTIQLVYSQAIYAAGIQNGVAFIRCGIASRPICWKRALISATFSSY